MARDANFEEPRVRIGAKSDFVEFLKSRLEQQKKTSFERTKEALKT